MESEKLSLKERFSDCESLKMKIEATEKQDEKLKAEVMNLASKQETSETTVEVNVENVK